MATVVELITYPVKGCAGTSLDRTHLTPAGLAHDRSFMVVGVDGVYRTQRRDPRLALVRPTVSADGTGLTLASAEPEGGRGALHLDVTTSAPRRDVDLFGATYQGIDQGDEAAAWLTDFLGAPSRLVRVPPEHVRKTDGLTPGTTGYADSGAVHVLSRASLARLHTRLAERGAPPLAMDRFRPNIVVDSVPGGRQGADWAAEPHAEDRIRRATIGAAELGYTKLAVRCAVTLVDQETGARGGPEPLRTLADYRRFSAGGVVFGAKFAVVRPGELSVGDEVAVEEWGEAEA
ncbi:MULTISPECIES: MOSC N-terminal beta barrel domain-containing protein [Streptomyces]|uniref:MOSC domain-containing protein n=1 Tax=Streptomyces TaxID=1883 RepID=UPI0028ADAFE1|nr:MULTISPECIES: MOSC N-terminal beta barrel domain-containing protein [Streptomyces]MDX2921570.1 MOSC N-terminal beta barrel domain-containing protein [Streptomyces sp. NE06-03C]MDX3609014.1 MOSC N-terminal beta barrel domain-containing protein [Streptomyces sp. FL06-04B]MDX3735238.1 MOSC N-terminal beta barrel domain-containing protein [Streptomyces sp. ID01-15D]